jgi:hypothetical protein
MKNVKARLIRTLESQANQQFNRNQESKDKLNALSNKKRV